MQGLVGLAFWTAPSGSVDLFIRIGVAFVFGLLLIAALLQAPQTLRRPIVVAVTFLSGLFYVLYYLWPRPIDRQPDELPLNAVETVSFWLDDSLSTVANFSGILSAFLIGLGIYSLLRVHGRRMLKGQKDWQFSAVLLLSMVAMVFFGYSDWLSRLGERGPVMDLEANWGLVNYGRDFLFEGLLQQMDAALFSIIAFYILSAAYRAFRVRSVEATILLATAFIVMLSLLGVVEVAWAGWVNPTGSLDTFSSNFTLGEVRKWISGNVQTASLRGIDFGIGIGALAMGLRLWLSLERGGATG